MSKLSKPRFKVGLAIVHRDGRWLVAKRRPDAHLGGLWEFPGGKCEPGEQPPDAAIRELREECGVEAEIERVLEPLVCEYDDRIVELTAAICRWVSGEAQALESDQCRWVLLSEMRKLDMPEVNAEIMREIEWIA